MNNIYRLLLIILLLNISIANAGPICNHPYYQQEFLNLTGGFSSSVGGWDITIHGVGWNSIIFYHLRNSSSGINGNYTITSEPYDGGWKWTYVEFTNSHNDLIFGIYPGWTFSNETGNYANIDFLACNDDSIIPDPTPTETSTIPGTATPTVTSTEGGGDGDDGDEVGSIPEYSDYDPDDTDSPYSSIPSDSGIDGLLKGNGFCVSGTCTASDLSDYIATYITLFWWLGMGVVLIRFYTLGGKK